MADKGGTSMSALGSFYDALFDFASKQKQNYGQAAVPDVVPGQIVDAVAEGIVEVAGSMSGMSTGAAFLQNQTVNKVIDGMGNKVGFTFSPVPGISSETLKFKRYDHAGAPGVEDEEVSELGIPGVDVSLSPKNITAALLSPAGLGNSIADAYIAQKKLERETKLLMNLFPEQSSGSIAAEYATNRMAGLDNDLASAISTVQKEKWSSRGDIESDKANQAPLPYTDDKSPQEAQAQLRRQALNTAVAAWSGELDQNVREAFVKDYEATMKKEMVDEYNKRVEELKIKSELADKVALVALKDIVGDDEKKKEGLAHEYSRMVGDRSQVEAARADPVKFMASVLAYEATTTDPNQLAMIADLKNAYATWTGLTMDTFTPPPAVAIQKDSKDEDNYTKAYEDLFGLIRLTEKDEIHAASESVNKAADSLESLLKPKGILDTAAENGGSNLVPLLNDLEKEFKGNPLVVDKIVELNRRQQEIEGKLGPLPANMTTARKEIFALAKEIDSMFGESGLGSAARIKEGGELIPLLNELDKKFKGNPGIEAQISELRQAQKGLASGLDKPPLRPAEGALDDRGAKVQGMFVEKQTRNGKLHIGVGDLIQDDMLKLIEKKLADPNLSPEVKRVYENAYNKVQNGEKMGEFLQAMSKGVDNIPEHKTQIKRGDGRHMMKLGLKELAEDWDGDTPQTVDPEMLRRVKAAREAAKQLDAQQNYDKNNARRALGHNLAYLNYRWQTLPTLNKIFTPLGLISGNSFLDLANYAGGLGNFRRETNDKTNKKEWKGFQQAYVPVGVNVAGVAVSKRDSKAKMAKDLFDIKESKSFIGKKNRALNEKALKFQGEATKYTRLAAKSLAAKDKAYYLKEAKRFQRKSAVAAGAAWDHKEFWSKQLGFKKVQVISHKANRFQKASYIAYAFSPGQMIGGLFNGDHYQRMLWIGSGFGKNLDDMSKWSRSAKWAHRMLNSNFYRGIVKFNRLVNFTINAPSIIAQELANKLREWTVEAAKRVARELAAKLRAQLMKSLMGKAIAAALAAITAGLSTLLQTAYTVLNIVTLGMLDKISDAALRITMQAIVGVVMGLILAVLLGLGSLGKPGSPKYLADSLGSGALMPPDPLYDPTQTAVSHQPPEPTGTPTNPVPTITIPGEKGIDVSHWDGDINWPTVKSQGHVEFAFIKATEGNDFLDPEFSKNWKNSKSAGIPRAAYHFFLGDIDGKSQAEYFLKIVDQAGGGEDFELAVDVEWPWKRDMAEPSVAAKNLKAMLEYIENARGYKPFIYTSYYAWQDMVDDPGWGGDAYPLWVAAYSSSPPTRLPTGWTKWTVWQYTDNGSVPGISTSVDLDLWNEGDK